MQELLDTSKSNYLKMWIIVFVLPIIFSKCLAEEKTIDLTWEFNNETIYWPGQQPFLFTKQVATDKDRGYWYAMNEFCAAEHGGTHFDAPYHFNKDGWNVAEVPVSRLYAKGAIIKIKNNNGENDSDLRLTVKDLQDWEERNGQFENGSVLLVNFARSHYWNTNKTKYMELDLQNKLNFPGVSTQAAQWIVKSGKFYGVGLDTPSIDPGNSNDMMVHRIFAEHQLYNLENVKLVVDLPEKGFDLIIAPMKIGGGSGGPVRIFAKIN